MANGKNNATCAICDKGYYMCQSCREQAHLSPWKLYTDTSEHYKVFQIVRGYNIGVYSKQDAKERLKNIDLSDKDTFKESVKISLDTILSDDNSDEKPIKFIDISSSKVKSNKKHPIVALDDVNVDNEKSMNNVTNT